MSQALHYITAMQALFAAPNSHCRNYLKKRNPDGTLSYCTLGALFKVADVNISIERQRYELIPTMQPIVAAIMRLHPEQYAELHRRRSRGIDYATLLAQIITNWNDCYANQQMVQDVLAEAALQLSHGTMFIPAPADNVAPISQYTQIEPLNPFTSPWLNPNAYITKEAQLYDGSSASTELELT